jgi:hypothetical protein
MKFWMQLETDVSQDHLPTVAASQKETLLDTDALLAQLVKLLIQTTSANASNNKHAVPCKSDYQETQETAQHAEIATSQLRSQTTLKPDAWLDQRPTATAWREELLMDINALHAHQVKSEISLIQTKPDVLHNQSVTLTQSNLLMMLTHAEDANNAHSDNDQTNWELLVSQFHLLFANALRDNLLIDTHAKHAQLDKLW